MNQEEGVLGRGMNKLARTIAAAALVAMALMAVPSGASAATTIGQTVSPGPCTAGPTRLQTTSPGNLYAAPSDGVITSWSFQAGSAVPSLKFKVGRPAGGNLYTIIGESALLTPAANILNTFPIQIPVQAGDLIGFYVGVAGQCGITGIPGFVHSAAAGDITPPNQATFTAQPAQMVQLDVSARLEPDCDKDGFGDETQDQNLSSCAPGTTPTGPAPTLPSGAPATCKGIAATIVGTNGSDVRTGSQGQDVIVALGGNDTLSGLAGNDLICGGAGKDTERGGKGKDTLLGQKGKDALNGGPSRDLCKGGKGTDTASKCEVEKSI
jgi:hypothetical protein